MKLYILRWNPAFSMKYEEHIKGMKLLKNGPVGSNWSIHDCDDEEESTYSALKEIYPNIVQCTDLKRLTGQILQIVSRQLG